MIDKRKSIFDGNHISDKLIDDQIKELKAYHHTYHRKCWAYKAAAKRFKRWKINRQFPIRYWCVFGCCLNSIIAYSRLDET